MSVCHSLHSYSQLFYYSVFSLIFLCQITYSPVFWDIPCIFVFFFGLVIFLYGCFQFGALLGLFSHWGNWLKSLLCSLCWITEHGEGGRKCILSSPQSVFLACVAFSSLPHVWNLFRDEAPLSLGKTQSCFAYWSAFSRLKFFSVSLCFMLFGGHWMFQILERFTKKKLQS